MTIRQEVMAALIETMEAADVAGIDPWAAAARTYPGTPPQVLAEAWVHFEDRQTEAWWRSLEKTIDGEVIRHALLAPVESK